MRRKLTTKEVVERFKKVHGDKYDYSRVEYDGTNTKVKIICREIEHGIFEQTPSSHMNGRGCRYCGYIKRGNSLRKTIEEFLDEAKLVHVDKYNYSLIEYVDSRTKVKIICKEDGHGIFEQNPTSHLQGIGCPKCGIVSTVEKLKLGREEFVERSNLVHNNFYGYEKVEYVNGATYVIIVCPVHGKFTQTPASHWSGNGCPQCGNIKQGDSKRKTKEKFIEEATLVHGDEYDYSLVEYVDTHTNISIICKKDGHGIFNQTPNGHLHGSGCPKCGHIKTTTKLSKSTDDFVKQAKEVHPDKNYGYEKVEYVNAFTKVVIVCPLHGDFSQSPDKHLQGNGCNDCGRISTIEKNRLTIDEFIERSNVLHNNFYDYEKVVYVNNRTDIIIICPKHGDFKQTPNIHLDGKGCNECGRLRTVEKQRKPQEQFIEEANLVHGGIYKYDNVDYKGAFEYVSITCKIHGDFRQTPGSHLSGSGCNDCGEIRSAKKQTKSQEQFIKEANLIHGGIYKYDNVDYKGATKKVPITCPTHGDFPQTPDSHLTGAGCPKCYNKNEGRLAVMLNEIGVVHRQYKIENKRYDFYLPDYNILIERDGEQHYRGTDFGGTDKNENLIFQQNNDQYKTNLAKSKSHKICRIPYWLREEDERKEIQNILNGQPTYPDVPDLEQAKSKPLPN
jgi:ssDNA-binding Zn-finger/Zn-ribbon topoisomerase 1